jgi:coenzyme PQQ precursor peptide PqqA
MTDWETPSFIEIDMSAEIGGYQGEDPGRRDGPDHLPDFVAPAPPSTSEQS